MKNQNPIVIGIAAGVGVFVSNLVTGNGTILTAFLAGAVVAVAVAGILCWRGRRRG